MCFAVPEAIWWARSGHTDLMVAYPSVDVPALTELASDPALTSAVAVMVDPILSPWDSAALDPIIVAGPWFAGTVPSPPHDTRPSWQAFPLPV